VRAVREAVALPLAVNGDIVDAASARAALAQSGADAVMVGRGVYGRPWLLAGLEAALAAGAEIEEPDAQARLAIVLEHMADSLRFYGERLGLRIFRKHLGWYVEQAPWPADAAARRQAKARLCRLESGAEVERALTALWTGERFAEAA
jgi:tRNA-dihydrouridine synthase